MMSIVMASCIVSAATVGYYVGAQNGRQQKVDATQSRVIFMAPRDVKVFYRKSADEDQPWALFHNPQQLERCLYSFKFEKEGHQSYISGAIDCTDKETIIEIPHLEKIVKEY